MRYLLLAKSVLRRFFIYYLRLLAWYFYLTREKGTILNTTLRSQEVGNSEQHEDHNNTSWYIEKRYEHCELSLLTA